MQIYMLRHGQTMMNKDHILQGQSNSDLSEKGIGQAEDLREKIREAGLSFDRIYCSPLGRTVQTCSIVTGAEKEEMILDNRLMEISLGEYEGRDFYTVGKEFEEIFMKYPSQFVPTKGGESFQQLIDRVQSFMDELKETENDDKILIVSHGGTLHAFIQCMCENKPLDTFWRPWIDNCTLIRAQLEDGVYSLEEKYRDYSAEDQIGSI